MNVLQLLLVGDDPLARAALTLRLADEPGVVLAGQLPAGDDWLELADDFAADVILWDVGWDPPTPLPDIGETAVPVLALVPEVELGAQALAAGARGALSRDAEPEALTAALQAIYHGLRVVDVWPSSSALPLASPSPAATLDEPLTAREQEVLQLLAEGLTNKAIGQQLAISDHTVKFHVTAIMTKLEAQSRTEAVVRATRRGLLML